MIYRAALIRPSDEDAVSSCFIGLMAGGWERIRLYSVFLCVISLIVFHQTEVHHRHHDAGVCFCWAASQTDGMRWM